VGGRRGCGVAITRNWSAKAEYLYVDLGSISGTPTTIGYLNPGVPVTHSHATDFNENIVRGGINYKF
jgi:outer membrane immunogenic protein